MKGLTIVAILVAICISTLIANDRALDADNITTFGRVALRYSNYGMAGGDDADGPALEWPRGSGINYLYQSALWIGGKVHRTNEDGEHLYWLNWPPIDEDDYVSESDDQWNENLQPVIDTLTSVGFDGDADVMELLPAYNPLEQSSMIELWVTNNPYDHTTVSYLDIANYDDDGDGAIDEDPPGALFQWPDPRGIYCFNLPFDDDGDGEVDEDGGCYGLETGLGFYYDISPFGTDVDRDWGSSNYTNHHYPLGVAVEQRVYAWNVRSLADAIVMHFRITNVTDDPINDCAFSYFVDPDIGPVEWGADAVLDDISSYNTDYDFAFAYDDDQDSGITPGYFAVKALGESDANSACFTWNRGHGPNDDDPRDLTHSGSSTANQKYWLQTGMNPDESRYVSLIENPDYVVNDPCETRFMYSVYGDDFDIEPGETRDFYLAFFLANSEFGLIEILDDLESFYESGFDLSIFDGDPSIPGIIATQPQQDGQSIFVDWYIPTMPDSLYLCYKEANAPAIDYQVLNLDTDTGSFMLENLAEETDYNIKVAVVYGDVYLESPVVTQNTTEDNDAEDGDIPPIEVGEMSVYPNPFNPETTIGYSLQEKGHVIVEVFNIRGQKVATLLDAVQESGQHSVVWDGSDQAGKSCTSGIYFCRLKASSNVLTRKMLLLK